MENLSPKLLNVVRKMTFYEPVNPVPVQISVPGIGVLSEIFPLTNQWALYTRLKFGEPVRDVFV